MALKVVKFGGTSLADAEQFRRVADIIKSDPNRRFVVASAPGKRFKDDIKVTDMLYQCYTMIKNHQDMERITFFSSSAAISNSAYHASPNLRINGSFKNLYTGKFSFLPNNTAALHTLQR